MSFDLISALVVGVGFAISGFFMELGKAITDVYFRPWLKGFKRRHNKIIRELRKRK